MPPPARPSGGLKVALAGLVALCLLLAGLVIGLGANRNERTTAASGGVTPLINAPNGTLPAGAEPAADVAKALGPAVVELQGSTGLGSGVIYNSTDGLILTNAHVVEGSQTMDVLFANGSNTPGRVLGADPAADIAVVKVDVPGLQAARLSETKVEPGQLAIAIGSPFGLAQSVTSGIVSAVDRPVDTGDATHITINMIQTDAPINHGNSGGALANRKGEVIGINSQIYSQSGDNNGIGFAIPIQTAKAVADKIQRGESLEHGWLGVSSVPPDDGTGGAQITDVTTDSPADTAGVQNGDIVIAVDGQPIKSEGDLSARIVAKSPGNKVSLRMRRGAGEVTVEVTLGKRPSSLTGKNSRKRTTPTTR